LDWVAKLRSTFPQRDFSQGLVEYFFVFIYCRTYFGGRAVDFGNSFK
jgi:hypothetical protein